MLKLDEKRFNFLFLFAFSYEGFFLCMQNLVKGVRLDTKISVCALEKFSMDSEIIEKSEIF